MTDRPPQPASLQVKTFLFIHVIWIIEGRRPLLKRSLLKVLAAHLLKIGEETSISIMSVDGAEDHLHILLRLHAVQNLLQVMRQLMSSSSDWLRTTQLVPADFNWQEGFMAYSVSPSAVKQVQDFLDNQEQYHRTRTLDIEWEVFEKAGTEIQKT